MLVSPTTKNQIGKNGKGFRTTRQSQCELFSKFGKTHGRKSIQSGQDAELLNGTTFSSLIELLIPPDVHFMRLGVFALKIPCSSTTGRRCFPDRHISLHARDERRRELKPVLPMPRQRAQIQR